MAVDGVIHRHNVLRRDVGLNIVNLLEDKAPARAKDFDLSPHMPPDRFWGGVGQNILRIAASAPKNNISSEFGFQLPGIHAPTGDLDWIDSVQAGFN